jgi:hypothetical protein
MKFSKIQTSDLVPSHIWAHGLNSYFLPMLFSSSSYQLSPVCSMTEAIMYVELVLLVVLRNIEMFTINKRTSFHFPFVQSWTTVECK